MLKEEALVKFDVPPVHGLESLRKTLKHEEWLWGFEI
jgi:hypothetical protein